MKSMRKQYLAMAQAKFQVKENRWMIVKRYFSADPGENGRYYDTEEEARRDLQRLIRSRNGTFKYDKDGKRIETNRCGMIGVDFEVPREVDEDLVIVAWKIKVRAVTDWEEVEAG